MFIDVEFAENIDTMSKAELLLYVDELEVQEEQLRDACYDIDDELYRVRKRLKTL